jgi:predicted outer membrane lipoprotein
VRYCAWILTLTLSALLSVDINAHAVCLRLLRVDINAHAVRYYAWILTLTQSVRAIVREYSG